MNTQPRIGISSCLLGHAVRYDGTDKLDPFISQQLNTHFEFINFCPEVAIGLGVPRETIALVGKLDHPRAIRTQTVGHDVTDRLTDYAQSLYDTLTSLAGYIVKTRSPSCGWRQVNVYSEMGGDPIGEGRGIFIAEIARLFPYLPVIDEEALQNIDSCYLFFVRVYTLHRWQQCNQQPLTTKTLSDFHQQHKYLLMAHSQTQHQTLEGFVSQIRQEDIEQSAQIYLSHLMATLAQMPNRENHCAVLAHFREALKEVLPAKEKAALNQVIDDYAQQSVPLSMPIGLLRTLLDTQPNCELSQQAYLSPFPAALITDLV